MTNPLHQLTAGFTEEQAANVMDAGHRIGMAVELRELVRGMPGHRLLMGDIEEVAPAGVLANRTGGPEPEHGVSQAEVARVMRLARYGARLQG